MNSDSEAMKWREEVRRLATDSFCVLPWLHVSTRTNGDMRVCCVANSAGSVSKVSAPGTLKDKNNQPLNLASSTMQAAWNQDYLRNIRTAMLRSEKPDSCQRCYREEAQGMVSKRLWETLHWHKKGTDLQSLIAGTTDSGETKSRIKYLDLRLGNTCNLGCIMCSSHDSSFWLRDQEQTYNRFTVQSVRDERKYTANHSKWWLKDSFWEEVLAEIPHLEELAFAGGEPLLIAQHRRLLKEIIAQNRSQYISLRYTTNGTVLDPELIELWQQFREVKITVSMDALGQRLEYIRWPIKSSLLMANLDLLDQTPENIKVNIAVTVQNLNILHLPDMIKWKVERNYAKINRSINESGWESGGGLFIVNLLWRPRWFQVNNLPQSLKLKAEQQFQDLEQWLRMHHYSPGFWQENPYGWPRIQALVELMRSQPDFGLAEEFKDYITVMDQQRGTDFAGSFAELKDLVASLPAPAVGS